MSTQGPCNVFRVDVLQWMKEADPALRWQVLLDLEGAPANQVGAARAHVENQGWGVRLLDAQGPNGLWDGGACFPSPYAGDEPGQPWTPTMHTLQTLQILGLEPSSRRAQRAISLVAENARWEHAGQRYFDGEVEPCINGRTIETGAYFGVDVAPLVERLLNERQPDGGWNCEAENGSVVTSIDTTINVLDGLLAYELAKGAKQEITEARQAAEEYLLERALFRRKTTGEVAHADFLVFGFPYYWRYDILRSLDYFRRSRSKPDPRMADAIEIVRSKQQPDGTWPLERIYPGRVHFHIEEPEGSPSRWNTLRAMRVLAWWERGTPTEVSPADPESGRVPRG